jgi:hypothetical protein
VPGPANFPTSAPTVSAVLASAHPAGARSKVSIAAIAVLLALGAAGILALRRKQAPAVATGSAPSASMGPAAPAHPPEPEPRSVHDLLPPLATVQLSPPEPTAAASIGPEAADGSKAAAPHRQATPRPAGSSSKAPAQRPALPLNLIDERH